MSRPLVLYCCTFRRDLLRLKSLCASIAKFNRDGIPFYVSVPTDDVALFRAHFTSQDFVLIDEREILRQNTALNLDVIYADDKGKKQQQLIKSEFWRMGVAPNTLVLDSDCQFIRTFGYDDFIVEGDVPYSVIHEGKWFLQFTTRYGPERARGEWQKDRRPIQQRLGRPGIQYDYGYAPFLWSAAVWQALDERYLKPNQITLWDAIKQNPSELTWYGEALLRYRPIPIWPRGEYFRHYHHEHELWFDQRAGFSESMLAKDYLGVVYQSNWTHGGDFGLSDKSWPSRVARQLRRIVKWLRFRLGR